MRIRVFLFLLFLQALGFCQTADEEDLLNLYVDSFHIDQAYLRQEIKFVHYVRIRQEADVHLLITAQRTGGRGMEYTMIFVGQNRFSGVDDTLSLVTNQTDSQEQIRKEMIRVVKLGLMQYVKNLPVSKDLTITYKSSGNGNSRKNGDKWNHWVVSIGINTFLNGQKATQSVTLGGFLNVRRVTEKWKMLFSVSGDYDEDKYDYEDVRYSSISRVRRSEFNMVRSLSSHWSAGVWGMYFSSTYRNIRNRYFVEPRVEYNIFPYSESTRQQLRIGYGFQPCFVEYFEETIYLKQKEILYEESLNVDMVMVKTWGSANIGLQASHYLHDFGKNRVDLHCNLSLKLIKGLSFNFHGNFGMQRDQLSLPMRDATAEEVLLRRRELESQYSYYTSMGFSYSFGALYNDIVNPRFGDWW